MQITLQAVDAVEVVQVQVSADVLMVVMVSPARFDAALAPIIEQFGAALRVTGQVMVHVVEADVPAVTSKAF